MILLDFAKEMHKGLF